MPVFVFVSGSQRGREVLGKNTRRCTWKCVWLQVQKLTKAQKRIEVVSVQQGTSMEPETGRSGFIGNGELGQLCSSVCVCLRDCAVSCLCFFHCVLALGFCSLITSACLGSGLACNCFCPQLRKAVQLHGLKLYLSALVLFVPTAVWWFLSGLVLTRDPIQRQVTGCRWASWAHSSSGCRLQERVLMGRSRTFCLSLFSLVKEQAFS